MSVTATVTALLALTTPFQQPTGCDSHFTITSFISTDNFGTTYTVPLAISEQVNSCYPSGWDSVVPESRLCFSPAVCPSGWTYFEMAENTEAASTAYCCDRLVYTFTLSDVFIFSFLVQDTDTNYSLSGYSLIEDPFLSDIFSTACGRWMSDNTMSVDSGSEKAITVENTFVVHEPWVITWMSDDTSTLTPPLPALTNGKRVPTWTPAEVIPDSKYDRREDNGSLGTSYAPETVVVIIVLPVLAGVGILSCIGCCVVCRIRRKRRERIAFNRAGTENEAITMPIELRNISLNRNKK